MVVITTSAPANKRQRDVQRRHDLEQGLPALRIRRIFVLGKNKDINQTEIETEARRYGDILQGGLEDSYRNLVLKTILGLQWFKEACHNVDYYMKTDDDVVLNARPLLQVLRYQGTSKPFLMGRCLWNRPVRRTRFHRHFLTVAQYAGETFPPFCEGSGYIMPANLAHDVARAVFLLPVFPIEDAFIGAVVDRLPYPVRTVDRDDLFSFNYDLHNHDMWCQKLRAHRIVTLHCADGKYLEHLFSCVPSYIYLRL